MYIFVYIFVYLGASAPGVYNVPIVVVEHYGTLFLRGYMAGAPLFDCSEDAAGSGWTAGRVAGKAAGRGVAYLFGGDAAFRALLPLVVYLTLAHGGTPGSYTGVQLCAHLAGRPSHA